MNWLKQIAPTIASCLGGPLAGLAVTAISKALGVDESKVNETIQDGKLSSDQIASIKEAEIQLQSQAQALGLNFEQLAVQDRSSAREMQSTTKSIIPPLLAIGVTIGFFGILFGLMTGKVDSANQALMSMLGSLGTAWVSIISFYFGSSAGSQSKDQLLYQSTPLSK